MENNKRTQEDIINDISQEAQKLQNLINEAANMNLTVTVSKSRYDKLLEVEIFNILHKVDLS